MLQPSPFESTVDKKSIGDLHTRYTRLRVGYSAERYPTRKVREDRLQRLFVALEEYAAPFCEALNADFGYRSNRQSYFADIATTGKAIRRAKKGIRRWMRPEHRHVDFPFSLYGGQARVLYQPLGVVGILSPWNVPVNLTLTPLAGVLAAGNRALIKPSEYTPNTAGVMQEMLKSAFADDEVGVVTGGVEVGQAFSAMPFDHLVFTGGESTAKHIMRAAADNLTPLTLELGGKSPVIIGSKADLALAAKKLAFGKIFNAGQVCLAPDYVLVKAEDRDELVKRFVDAIRQSLPEGIHSADYVSVINDRQAQRIHGYLQQARDAGAEIHETSAGTRDGNLIPITVIVDPPEDLAICKEEIFGPVLVILSYETLTEAIGYVNDRPKPLALYFFGNDAAERRAVLTDTSSGGVSINDVIMHYTFDDLPFGGVGPSGMGSYHGFDGFKQFSNARAVYKQTRIDLGRIIRPPYGQLFDRFSRFLLRYG